MEEKSQVQGITVKAEETNIPAKAQMKVCDPVQEQIDEDDRILKNPGDSRTMIRKGTIHFPDGKHKIAVDLEFVRTRNKKGGVDVLCKVPCFVNTAEVRYGN